MVQKIDIAVYEPADARHTPSMRSAGFVEHAVQSQPAAEKSIGTGHGRNQSSQARYVQFERESDAPSEVIAIRYDTRANLVARGIIEAPAREPNPFPARFVADPPRRW